MKDGVARESLQIVEHNRQRPAHLLVKKVQQLDHATATHEVAMARDIVSENFDDGIAASRAVLSATVLLAMESVSIALLFRVGDATVDDRFADDFVHNDLAHAMKEYS